MGEQKWVPQPAKQTVVQAALRTQVAEPCGIWEVLGFIPSVLGGLPSREGSLLRGLLEPQAGGPAAVMRVAWVWGEGPGGRRRRGGGREVVEVAGVDVI